MSNIRVNQHTDTNVEESIDKIINYFDQGLNSTENKNENENKNPPINVLQESEIEIGIPTDLTEILTDRDETDHYHGLAWYQQIKHL